MRIRNLLLTLLLIVAASVNAAVGDILKQNKLTIGINGDTPKKCTEWKTYQWDGLLRFVVTNESPKECMLYGKYVAGTTYEKALTDNGGQLKANESCHLVVPDEVNGYKVVGASSFALYEIDFLTSVQFPEGVRVIENPAVHDCDNLTYVSLPSTIEEIGQTSFAYCDKLKYVVINRETPPEVGEYSFQQRVWSSGEWVIPERQLLVPAPVNYDKEPWTKWFKSENIICSDINLYIAGIRLTGTDEEATQRLLEDLAELDEGLMEDFFEGIPEIHFDEATNTLTLKDLRMTVPADMPGIMNGLFYRERSGIQGLKVEIQGECELRGGDNMIYDADGGIQFIGDGTLKVKAGAQGARVMNLMSIDGPTVEIESTDVAVFADNNKGTAKVAVVSGSLNCFGQMTMQQFEMGDGIKIWDPFGAIYAKHNDTYGIVKSGAFVADQWISIEHRESLPLVVCGQIPSDKHGEDLVGFVKQLPDYANGLVDVSGHLKYQDGKLYMSDFEIEYKQQESVNTCLMTTPDNDLEVVLSGDNRINGFYTGFDALSQVTFSADEEDVITPTLNLKSRACCIYIRDDCKVTCQGVNITAEGDWYAILAEYSDVFSGAFEFQANDDNSNELLMLGGSSTIVFNTDLENRFVIPDNYAIISPDDAKLMTNLIVDAQEQLVANEWVIIAKRPSRILPIGIAFQQITDETDWDELNRNLAESYGMTGSFSYDDESHTLTLHQVNANIDFESGGFIEVYDAIDFPGYESFFINIEGDNSIENTGSGSCIQLHANNVTLTGNGTLTLKNSMDMQMDDFMGNAISMMGGEDEEGNPHTLTIDGPSLTAEADNSLALYIDGALAVQNGELRARGLLGPLYVSNGLMAGNGIGILNPEGAYYNPDNGYIMQGDDYVQGNIWFVMGKTTPTAIAQSVYDASPMRQPIYDLQGRLVARGYEGTQVRGYENSLEEGEDGHLAPSHPRTLSPSIKKGLYIIGTRKVVVK